MDTIDRDLLSAEEEAEEEIERPDTRHSKETEPDLSRRHTADISRLTTAQDKVSRGNASRVELDRIATYTLQHRATVGSTRTSTVSKGYQQLGAGKPYPPDFDAEQYEVQFTGSDDPLHPHNWRLNKKLVMSVVFSYVTLTASFASAIFSSTVTAVAEHFHVGEETATLGISLYVLGFASGPTVWAPLSELNGRRLPLVVGLLGYAIFTIGSATSKDIQTLMITRFFAGFFAASPLAIVPACFADMYDHAQRGIAITAFAMAVFVGPFLSPIVGGFITMSHLHWRWTMYISSIMGFLGLFLLVVFCPETYAPAILVAKARALRRETNNWGIHAKQDEIEVNFHELMTTNFSRPLRMLATEPIVLLVTLYMSFIYGLMYALLGAYPLVFEGVHGMNLGVSSLPFIGLIVGEGAGGLYILSTQKSFVKKLEANDHHPVPEWRLPPVLVGGVFFSAGMFWFGWTGFTPSIHWIAPTCSGIFTGFGILCIFLQCFNYLIDSYLSFAASVFAANTIMRSAIGSAFPLFTRQMFDGLGIQYAGTLLGCVAAVMVPIPIAFMVWGPKLREKSKFGEPTYRKEESAEKNEPESE